MLRRYLAAPSQGIIAEDDIRSGVYLSDRIANGEAFSGERIVRLPRRFFRTRHGVCVPSFWSLKRTLAGGR
jgi:hypothetical protein